MSVCVDLLVVPECNNPECNNRIQVYSRLPYVRT